MSITRMLPAPTTHLSEFYGYTGDCMEAAMTTAMASSEGVPATSAMLNTMVAAMKRTKTADTQGQATLHGIVQYARDQKFTVDEHLNGAFTLEQLHADLLGARGAGVRPIVIEVSNGQALRDFKTGSADGKGLQYHGICIVGVNPTGYIVSDPDNPQVKSQFQMYPWATLIAAKPYAYCIVDMKRAIPAPPKPVETLPVPSKDDVAALKQQLADATKRIQDLTTQLDDDKSAVAAAMDAEAAIKALKDAESQI